MKATFLKSNILSVIILSLMLTGCMGSYAPGMSSAPAILSGDVLGTGPGTAKWIVEQALASKAGTEIWYQGTNYLFSAPVGQNIGFTLLDTAGEQPINICSGNISSCQTFKGLVTELIGLGWRQLAVLPEYTITVIQEYAGALTTPVIIVTSPYSPIATGIVQ